MTAKKRCRVTAAREDRERAQEIKDREWAQSLTDTSLIEWLAQIAHDGDRNWSFLRRELLRRMDNAAASRLQSERNKEQSEPDPSYRSKAICPRCEGALKIVGTEVHCMSCSYSTPGRFA